MSDSAFLHFAKRQNVNPSINSIGGFFLLFIWWFGINFVSLWK